MIADIAEPQMPLDRDWLKAPFPAFGGKSRVAGEVWRRFGNVRNYVEPFCFSAAVLLARPHAPHIETINDKCAFVSNFWRAVKCDRDGVVDAMDWPVNECDLEARHKWLVDAARKREHAERMRDDEGYYDAKMAGYWAWGMSQWIGGGWCGGEWNGRGGDNSGTGVNVKDEKRGGKRPHIGRAGTGVHRSSVGETCAERSKFIEKWIGALADRLRRVRVCCGDWERVCGSRSTVILPGTPCGVFLDPPYRRTVNGKANRTANIYASDSDDVDSLCDRVQAWCLEWGRHDNVRIALCGYDGEYDLPGWSVVEWKAGGGYANLGKNGQGLANRHRERVWFSPACIESESEALLCQ